MKLAATLPAFAKRLLPAVGLLFATALSAQSFSLEQVMSYPFPSGLTAASQANRIAWTFNEQGRRNLWVAEAPDFVPRQRTRYDDDSGQALSSIRLSPNGAWVVYIRGGDFGSNWDDALPVNPHSLPEPPKVELWVVPFDEGAPRSLGPGEQPAISPDSRRVAFVRDGQIWVASLDGSAEPRKLFHARGRNDSPVWSPDGTMLAFRSDRGDHAFIGIWSGEGQPLRWLDPSYDRDETPRWSPDGKAIAFVRRPGRGGAPDSILAQRHWPWEIRVAELGSDASRLLWKAPETLRGSYPTTHGRTNLHWAHDRIVFLSYHDGWPHLYSIAPEGGAPRCLTPGPYMCEYISLSPDGKYLYCAANTGPDPLDLERRHVLQVPVDRVAPRVLTPGDGLEWTPFALPDGRHVALISATAQRPPLPAIYDLDEGRMRLLGEDRIPADFPDEQLVTPTQVIFSAPDGLRVHGTLFLPKGASEDDPRPAVVYVHGGPPRQMLLGWHYSSYYSNAYAVNQYLTSLGFVVLSVNYRLGIGYGYEFHHPPRASWRGCSEYQDIEAAGRWLAELPFVRADRVGIYGGSYGGYLTAMALGRNSDLFAAGVDIHGVHDRTVGRVRQWLNPDGYERAPDAEAAARVAWESSPVAYVAQWRSPVLVIHGDDDRNVPFSQSTDLVQRLRKHGVPHETLVITDDTHHFMRFAHQLRVNRAAAEFLKRKLMDGSGERKR